MPAEQLHGDAAERRRNRRADGQDHADQVHDAGRALAGEEVAHDGARDGDAGRRADALHEAGGDQQIDRRRNNRGKRGGEIDAHEGDDDRLAPEPVRKRAADQLRKGKAGEIERQRQLDCGFGGAEGVHDLRHGRREQRHGDRPDRGQQRADHADAASRSSRPGRGRQPRSCRVLAGKCGLATGWRGRVFRICSALSQSSLRQRRDASARMSAAMAWIVGQHGLGGRRQLDQLGAAVVGIGRARHQALAPRAGRHRR